MFKYFYINAVILVSVISAEIRYATTQAGKLGEKGLQS